MHPVPTIAIVGRANVGKSTLFNRLLESRKALVSSIPGTTRDRAEGLCIWRGMVTRVLDTGGTDIKHPDDIEAEIIRQADTAMESADAILFLVDGQIPPTDFDRRLAQKIERLGKPFLIAANKCDRAHAREREHDAWSWKYGTPQRISALRGHGVGDLLDGFYEALKKIGKPPAEIVDVKATRVTVIGRPNVGKSSLLNRLLGEGRFIVSPVEHTTREPNDMTIEKNGRTYIFVDTAGIRRQALKQDATLEKAAVVKSLQTIKRTDIVLFTIEAGEDVAIQERILAGKLADAGVGILIVVNKWDLIPEKETHTMKAFEEYFRSTLPMLSFAPMIFVSALTGQRVESLYGHIDAAEMHRHANLDEEELEAFLKRAVAHHKPAKGMGTAPPKILGFKQISTAPPRFELAIKSRHKKKLQSAYVRYLEHRLEDEFHLEGSPIRIDIRPVGGGS